MFLADITVTLPWAIWSVVGTAIAGSVGWLARLTLKALAENRVSNKEMHDEVVALTREVASSLADNTAALREMAKSIDTLTTYVLQDITKESDSNDKAQ